MTKFEFLVSEGTGSTSDLEKGIKALLLWADIFATDEEKANFINWLGDDDMIDVLRVGNTIPSDHFESCSLTWEQLIASQL